MMNNQQFNQPLYGGNAFYNQGVVYGQQPQVKRANPLTREEILSLKTKTPFSLAVTQDDINRGVCFHVDENGVPATITDPDGTTTCTVCGKKWNSNELTQDQVAEATQQILSVLQTIKLMYVNFPDQAAREFYQILPLIEKIPQLYKIAADNFRAFEGNYTNGYYNGAMNPFSIFGQIAGGNAYANAFQYQQTQPMGAPMYQQPMGVPTMPMGQPAYAQQPIMNPPTYAPNPFDAASYAQQGAYAPATAPNYAYAPGQVQPGQPVAPAAAPAQPAAPAAPADVTSNGNHTP